MGPYPSPGRHRPQLVARPQPYRLTLLGTASDYLIRTASVLSILAVLGVAGAVAEQPAPTVGAAATAPTHQVASHPALRQH
ncbi:MAG: hypothetical protein H0V92_08120 [Pseudonocardiales bacterium]|nr:hypothetical protein [Pseudonocardiales bacterium]